MKPTLWKELIADLRAGKPEAPVRLDALGLLAAPGESREAFADRLERLQRGTRELRGLARKVGKVQVAPGVAVRRGDAISEEICGEAWEVTEALYGVRPEWVPGFFVNERFGFLWGGCSLYDPESGLNLFIIRRNFRNRKRWFCYHRTELMAHELCHAARQALDDWRFEEYFAYRTARSPLRRYLGNCFVRSCDAWGFLLPVLLLPVMQVLEVCHLWRGPVWPFWILALLYPVFLLIRNGAARKLVDRAEKNLRKAGFAAPWPLLFRLTAPEIRAVARAEEPSAVLNEWCGEEPRGIALRHWLKQARNREEKA